MTENTTIDKHAEDIFCVGDRVSRKPINNFKSQSDEVGTIVNIFTLASRAKIKWDKKSNNGQQHSTIQLKFLDKK